MVKLAKSKNKHITRKTQGNYSNNNQYVNKLNSALNITDPYTLYEKSLNSNRKRINNDSLRVISKTIPIQRAFSKISNGVLNMNWKVNAPKEVEENNPEEAEETKRIIKQSLLRPNYSSEINTYRKLIHAIIDDLLCLNHSIIERQPGKKDKPFWLWAADPTPINRNPDWSPEISGITPKYYESQGNNEYSELYESELFSINLFSNTYQSNPESPVEIAYRMINFWIGITNYQGRTTSQPTRNSIICLEDLEDVSGEEESELNAFREWWQTNVVGLGKHPIVGGQVSIKQLGGGNDNELYPQYTEFLLKMLALALNMSPRDFNITEKDNRATSLVAADATYQDAILPIAHSILEALSLEVVDFYFPGYSLEYTSLEPRSFEKEAKVATDLYQKGVITKNESRDRIGEERIDSEIGDVFIKGDKLNQNTEDNNQEKPPKDKDEEEKTKKDNVKTQNKQTVQSQKSLF